MKIALAQTSPILGDIAANLTNHLDLITRAVSHQVDLMVFPELSLTGYDLRERSTDLALPADAPVLEPLVEASRLIDIQFGLLERGEDGRPFNSGVYLSGGGLRHVHRKTYLPNYGRFSEGRYFAHGNRIRAFDLQANESRLAKTTPSGNIRIGTVICEELWHQSVTWLLGQDGAELLIVQTAASIADPSSPDELSKSLEQWEALALAAAITNRAFLILVNRVGSENDFHYFGRSFVVSPQGGVIARAPAFETNLLVVDVELAEVARARDEMPLLRDERRDLVLRELERISRKRNNGTEGSHGRRFGFTG